MSTSTDVLTPVGETNHASAPSYHRTTVIHGREISYWEFPGQGVPYVMLHGVGSSAKAWQEVAERLHADGAHVIAIDLPGHGSSYAGPGDYSLGALASTVRDLLDVLDIEHIVLVGHSLGGGVSMQFMYQFPGIVSGLVLVSSGGLGTEANMLLRLATIPGAGIVMKVALNQRTIAWVAAAKRGVKKVGVKSEVISDVRLQGLQQISTEAGRRTFLATLRSVVDHTGQRVSALEKLSVSVGTPVLIVWGAKDAIIPLAHGEAAHAMLADSTLVVFEDMGHEVHRRDAYRFADTVRRWRDEHDL